MKTVSITPIIKDAKRNADDLNNYYQYFQKLSNAL